MAKSEIIPPFAIIGKKVIGFQSIQTDNRKSTYLISLDDGTRLFVQSVGYEDGESGIEFYTQEVVEKSVGVVEGAPE